MSDRKTTTVSVRLSKSKKNQFVAVCEKIGLNQQDVLEKYIDEILDNHEELEEQVVPVREQIMQVIESGASNRTPNDGDTE